VLGIATDTNELCAEQQDCRPILVELCVRRLISFLAMSALAVGNNAKKTGWTRSMLFRDKAHGTYVRGGAIPTNVLNQRRLSLGVALTGLTLLLLSGGVRAQEQIVLASYGGTIEQFMRNTAIPAFEKETGIKVVYVAGTALSLYSKVLATRQRPEIDVYWSNDLTHLGGKLQGLYDKLDPAIVTNLKDVVNVALDPDGIGVASHITAVGIQYNARKFTEAGWAPPTSWLDLWDAKYKGKIAIFSIGVLFSQDFLGLMTRLTGGSEKDIGPAIRKIKELRPGIVAFPSSPAEMDSVLNQEQAWITYNVGVRAAAMKLRGSALDFVFPKEGGTLLTVNFEVVKGAPNPTGAQKFINHMLSEQMQEKAATEMGYGAVNRKVTVPEHLRAYIPDSKNLGAFVRLDRNVMNRDLDQWIEAWNKEVEGK
jgi:putative spermidine/putrescine transport system substrate-binding protein